MSWKYGVYGVNESKLSFNNCAFATKDEAERAGFELSLRWMGMDGYEVVESEEPVNYEFPETESRPRPIMVRCLRCGNKTSVGFANPDQTCPRCRAASTRENRDA